jgi:hypothetical protein
VGLRKKLAAAQMFRSANISPITVIGGKTLPIQNAGGDWWHNMTLFSWKIFRCDMRMQGLSHPRRNGSARLRHIVGQFGAEPFFTNSFPLVPLTTLRPCLCEHYIQRGVKAAKAEPLQFGGNKVMVFLIKPEGHSVPVLTIRFPTLHI